MVESKLYCVVWKMRVNNALYSMLFPVRCGEDPLFIANNVLTEHIGKNNLSITDIGIKEVKPGFTVPNFSIEPDICFCFSVKPAPGSKEAEVKRWRIEIGPVFEGAGPGDGSDAPFDIKSFHGTYAQATAEAMRLCQLEREFDSTERDYDIGTNYEVSYSISEWNR